MKLSLPIPFTGDAAAAGRPHRVPLKKSIVDYLPLKLRPARREALVKQARQDEQLMATPKQANNEKLFATWDAWANAGTSDEKREKAVMAMKRWMRLGNPNIMLDLYNLGLKELPPLPPNVRYLNISCNSLSGELSLSSNEIRELYAWGNQFTHLSTPFLPKVERVDISNNFLTHLPDPAEMRCPKLKYFVASNNLLEHVHDAWLYKAPWPREVGAPVAPPQIHLHGNPVA